MRASMLALFLVAVLGSVTTFAAPGETKLVSRRLPGPSSGNQSSVSPVMSAAGRYVAYSSLASDLVPGDVNGREDVFVHDLQSGSIELISIDSVGIQGNSDSNGTAITADGRYVAFSSIASNLVPGDTNASRDIFVRDRATGNTERVSLDSAGLQPTGDSSAPAISPDGRFVVFTTAAPMVAGDSNGVNDVFVRDRLNGITERISIATAGLEANAASTGFAISADGRYVSFESQASNLVMDDSNGATDAFIRDRVAGTTERVSVDSAEMQANAGSFGPMLNGDGRYVVFYSAASSYDAGDTNGTFDVFLRDRSNGTTARVSLYPAGTDAFVSSSLPSISADGRFVTFKGASQDFRTEVFLRDLTSGTTEQVSLTTAGVPSNGSSSSASVSADGRYVAFASTATNLTPAFESSPSSDVFVRDRLSARTTHASLSIMASDVAAGGSTLGGVQSISADGRFLAFASTAATLVSWDSNLAGDIFVADLTNDSVERIDIDSTGPALPRINSSATITADGRSVAFFSGNPDRRPIGIFPPADVRIRDRVTGATEIVTTGLSGPHDPFDSRGGTISADGRYAAFVNLMSSSADTLRVDLFLKDRVTGTVELVTVSSAGVLGDAPGSNPVLSADGRYTAFQSQATNLVPGDTNDHWDVFVRDRVNGTTERVSTDGNGLQANADSFRPSISADGRYVAFESASPLVAADTNGVYDVYVKDRVTGAVQLISTGAAANANADSGEAAISGDGRYVAFQSYASNLVPGDINSTADIFVRDRSGGTTELITVADDGVQSDADALAPSLSFDGRVVAFQTKASNLTEGDLNGSDDVYVRRRTVGALWRSYDVVVQGSSPQASVTSVAGGAVAQLEFYESTNVGGIAKDLLFGSFTSGAHTQAFNHVEQFWSASGADSFPYAGKSSVNRGADAGEANVPAPAGVRDLQLHPPGNGHLTVAAFRVPASGTYSVTDLALRRVDANGYSARLMLFDAQGIQRANLQSTSRAWVGSAATYDLGAMNEGEYIYFAVDSDGTFYYDATEIAWQVHAAGAELTGPAPTCSLSVTPSAVAPGGSATLTWITSNADSLSINQGIGAATPVNSGSRSIMPGEATTFSGTVTGPGGTAACSVTVTIAPPPPPPPPTCVLNAAPALISLPNYWTLSWTTKNATSLTIDHGVGLAFPVTGSSERVPVVSATTYTGTVTGPSGTSTCSVTINVDETTPPPTCTLTATPGLIVPGASSSLSWTTTNATSLSINQGVGLVTPVAGGARTVSPASSLTYTGTVTGPAGAVTCAATVTVLPPTAAEIVWRSHDAAMNGGSPQGSVTSTSGSKIAQLEFYESTNIGGIAKSQLFSSFTPGPHTESFNKIEKFWSSGAAASYPHVGMSTVNRDADVGESNAPAPSGVRDMQLHPPANGHLVVAAFEAPESGTYSVTNLGVRRVDANGLSSRLIVFNQQGGQVASLRATSRAWVLSGATYDLGYTTAGQFIYFAVDSDGTYDYDATEIAWQVHGTPFPQSPLPACVLSATPGSVSQGSGSTLSWSTVNATALSIDQGIGAVTPVASGSTSVVPIATTTYRATVSGPAGSATCTATIIVTPASAQSVWNSYDAVVQGGSPQGSVTSATGNRIAQLEFYESTDAGGIARNLLFGSFTAGAHAYAFNKLEKFWSAGGAASFPYAGKSTVDRGSDSGETNIPAPMGVRDMQLHPPNNGHLTVAAFKVPDSGSYSVTGLAARRVDANGYSARLILFDPQGVQVANLQTASQAWTHSAATYDLGSLSAGQYIYFAVDADGIYDYDATEIAWQVTRASP